MKKNNNHIDIQLLTRSLSGETSSKEEELIATWLADSEANRKEFKHLKKTWEMLGQTNPLQEIDVDAEWEYLQGKLLSEKPEGQGVFLKTILRVAAAIIILFGVGILGRQYFNGESIKTDLAETEVIQLPDGSKVTLNADSKLSYTKKFAKDNRQVALKGEAYFEVVPDAENPFIIKIDDAEIKVLGTSFNVRAYGKTGNIEVTVAEGKVSIYNKNQAQNRVIAKGGEKAEYIRAENTARKVERIDRNYLSWKTRLMVFEDDNLSEVVRTISQVYHKEIRITNHDLDNCRLTTRFEEKDLKTVLSVLESTFDITLVEEKDVIYLSGAGCE